MGLKAAGANPRPNGGQDIRWAAAVVAAHFFRCPSGDPQGGAPPARMGSGYAAADRVIEQHRDAVSRKDGQADTRLVSDQAVRLIDAGGGWVGLDISPCHRADKIAVDLMIFHQAPGIRTDRSAEADKILPDIGRVIPPVSPQIQAVPWGGGYPTQPSRKPVGRPPPGRVHTGIKKDAMALLTCDIHGRPPSFS